MLSPTDLIASLFESVLVCDVQGKVVQRVGFDSSEAEWSAHRVGANLLEDPCLAPIRSCLHDGLAGLPFVTFLPSPMGGQIRVRGIPRTSGNEFWLVVGFEPESPAVDRVRSLGSETSEYAFVLRQMQQGMWRTDLEGTVRDANDYLVEWLQTSRDEIIGSQMSQWMRALGPEAGPFDAEFVTALNQRRRGKVVRSELVDAEGLLAGRVDVISDITQEVAFRAHLVEEVRRMSQLAQTDTLTGLPNRIAFEHRLAELREGLKHGVPFALVVVDIDDLKRINERKGHSVGDEALVQVAQRLKQAVRQGDLVARIGGDDFVALVPGVNREEADEVLTLLRVLLSEASEVGTYSVRTSVGLIHSDDGIPKSTHASDLAGFLRKPDDDDSNAS
jgi:diguanylate cyclase (GGDEF)-like protein